MTLDHARAFVTHIPAKTRQWVGFYSGSLIKQVLGNTVDPVLRKCWFWLEQYGPNAVVPPTWATCTMRQCTDCGPHNANEPVDGIGACDRDRFNGTPDRLNALWSAG